MASLLALTLPFATLAPAGVGAAETTTAVQDQSGSQTTLQAGAEGSLSAGDTQVSGSASLALSADTSGGTVSAGTSSGAQVVLGSDGGTAPVPETSTWISLGGLILVGLALVAWDRRRKVSKLTEEA